ncbi:MAG: hydroxyacid dehydrogenase [Kiritimatiellae bacterium]|nr:hydroxyacid dehydrogenase [Kiritimatiellia bacterium]
MKKARQRPADVVFYEAFAEEAAALRALLPRGVRAVLTGRTIQERGDAEPPAALVSIRTQSILPPAWAPRLSGVLTRSTGYDHLRRYRERAGRPLPCGYLPRYCARAVAEHAAMLWLALLRRLPLQLRQFAAFDRDGLTGGECLGRTLTVVGVGNIGREIARVGRGLGLRVRGVDLARRHPEIDYVPPARGLAEADVIVCAMNLTARNAGYFNRAAWRRVRPGALFVNIARGELAPTADLAWALDTGRLAGAGLDVFEDESEVAVAFRTGRAGRAARALRRLARRPNVLLTPHNAFNTAEAVRRKAEQAAAEVARFLRTGAFRWPVP